MKKNALGNIILLITAMIWGTSFVAQSAGMDYIGPFTFNSIRTILGGIVLIPVIAFSRLAGKKSEVKDKSLQQKTDKISVIGGIFCGIALCLASSFQQVGMVYTTAGKAGFITALYIIIVPFLTALFFHKKIGAKIFLCVIIAVIGFYMLCIKENFSLSKGDALVLVCALFFSVHIVIIDYFTGKNVDCVLMSCVQFFVAGIIMAACMFIFEQPNIESILDAKVSILYSGVMSCGVAYTLQIVGQKRTDPTVATLLLSLESVFAALSGWLILKDDMSLKEIIGCIFVFAAVILAQVDIKSLIKKKQDY